MLFKCKKNCLKYIYNKIKFICKYSQCHSSTSHNALISLQQKELKSKAGKTIIKANNNQSKWMKSAAAATTGRKQKASVRGCCWVYIQQTPTIKKKSKLRSSTTLNNLTQGVCAMHQHCRETDSGDQIPLTCYYICESFWAITSYHWALAALGLSANFLA